MVRRQELSMCVQLPVKDLNLDNRNVKATKQVCDDVFEFLGPLSAFEERSSKNKMKTQSTVERPNDRTLRICSII